jgi:hypothetical protein
MRKLFLLLLLAPVFCSAQSVNELDIKNGFLQFHLGDSITAYKDYTLIPLKKHPDQNEVRPPTYKLHKHLDKLTLVNQHGIVTEIDLMVSAEPDMQFMDDLLYKAYGPGTEIHKEVRNDPGVYLTYTRWVGKRVTLLLIQTNINKVVNNVMTRGRYQSIVFLKNSDEKMDGILPDGFPL